MLHSRGSSKPSYEVSEKTARESPKLSLCASPCYRSSGESHFTRHQRYRKLPSPT